MGSNGPNIPLVCLAAANALPSWSFVPMAVKGVLAPAPADSMIGRRYGHSAAGTEPNYAQEHVTRKEYAMPNTDDLAVAIYNTHDEAEQAVKTLERAGFDMRKLSIVGKDYHTAETAPDWLRPRLLARTAGCWVLEMPVRRCKR